MINPQFSLYERVNMHSVQNIFTAQRSLMTHWCKGIEETVLKQHLSVTLYVGFQHLVNFHSVQERYQRLAELTGHVYVFSEHDAVHNPINNIHFVELTPFHRLTQEWFLVVEHPHYSRAMIARALNTSSAANTPALYEGVLTSDKAMIAQLHQQLRAVLAYEDKKPVQLATR